MYSPPGFQSTAGAVVTIFDLLKGNPVLGFVARWLDDIRLRVAYSCLS